MIKCEVIKEFTLREFNKLENIVRKSIDEKGKLFVGDVFECDEKMYKYLTGENPNKDIVVQLIETMPELNESDNTVSTKELKEEKPKKKKASKK